MAASTYDSTTTEGYRITCEEVRGGIERTEYRGIEGFKCPWGRYTVSCLADSIG